MERKTNFEDIGFYEDVTVVIKNYDVEANVTTIAFHLDNDYEYGEMLKFGDVLKECRKRGYHNGTIHLITETYTSGKIYRYGNYRDDFWYEVGSMVGFA